MPTLTWMSVDKAPQDILVATNIVELPTRQFGLVAAGVVTRIGASVKHPEW
jgi:hypothetical protein